MLATPIHLSLCYLQTLCGNKATFLELISNGNFERNLRSLKSAYEQYVLNMAELDERILLDYRKINTNSRKYKYNINKCGEKKKIWYSLVTRVYFLLPF